MDFADKNQIVEKSRVEEVHYWSQTMRWSKFQQWTHIYPVQGIYFNQDHDSWSLDSLCKAAVMLVLRHHGHRTV